MGWFLFVLFLLSLFLLSIPISIEPGFILPSNNKNPKEKNNNQVKPFGGLLQPSLLLLLLLFLFVCVCAQFIKRNTNTIKKIYFNFDKNKFEHCASGCKMKTNRQSEIGSKQGFEMRIKREKKHQTWERKRKKNDKTDTSAKMNNIFHKNIENCWLTFPSRSGVRCCLSLSCALLWS